MIDEDWLDDKTKVLFEIGTCLHTKKGMTFSSVSIPLSDKKREVKGEVYTGMNPIVSVETTNYVLYDVMPIVSHVEALLNEGTPFIVALKKDGVFQFVKWSISSI